MAYLAGLSVASTGTRGGLNSVLYPPHSLRSGGGDGGLNEFRMMMCGSHKAKVTVKAMAKFKGTLMREKKLTEMIEKKVMEAKEVCEGDRNSDECKVAWDEVEEVSQAKADLRLKLEKQDPLEYFCQDNPETDECRIYDD